MGLIHKIYQRITAKKQHIKDLWFMVDLYGMRSEIEYCMKNQHMSLEEAMQEWDIYPYDLSKLTK